MTVKNLEHRAVFEGDVVMVKENMTITADHAEVTFTSAPASGESAKTDPESPSAGSPFGQNEISLIHAVGHVVLQQADKRAQSQEAFYYQSEERVVLIGEPTVWEKDYQVTGTKMTIFLRENRSLIEGSKVVIHPKEQESR